jgi:hypothetical protein
MEENSRHIELFDKYSQSTLSTDEKRELENLISSDPSVKLEFETHKLLVDGVRKARKEELREYLRDHGKVEYFENIWSKKWRVASAAIVILFTAVYFVMEYAIVRPGLKESVASEDKNEHIEELKKDENKTENNASRDKLSTDDREEDISLPPPPELMEVNDGQIESDSFYDQEIEEVVPSDDIVKEDADLLEFAPKTNSTNKDQEYNFSTETDSEKNLFVAQEEKILDTNLLAVIVVEKIVVQNKSLDEIEKTRTSERKKSKSPVLENESLEEPEADSTQSISKSYKVEIWKSPLNFKGYHYQGEILKLYGINVKEVSLIEYNNGLYIKVKEKYALLKKSTEYLPFKYISNKELIKKLGGN